MYHSSKTQENLEQALARIGAPTMLLRFFGLREQGLLELVLQLTLILLEGGCHDGGQAAAESAT